MLTNEPLLKFTKYALSARTDKLEKNLHQQIINTVWIYREFLIMFHNCITYLGDA